MRDRLVSTTDEIVDAHLEEMSEIIASGMDKIVSGFSVPGGDPQLPPEHFQTMSNLLGRHYRSAIGAGVEIVSEEIGYLTKNRDRLTNDYLASFGRTRLAQILSTTRTLTLDYIRTRQARGEKLPTILPQLAEEIPRIAFRRARIILETEGHSAIQFASQRTAEASNIPLIKIWNTIQDSRTRSFGESGGRISAFNHWVMDGMAVPVSDPFGVPQRFGQIEHLMYPGDSNGSAGNIINCRCVQTYMRE